MTEGRRCNIALGQECKCISSPIPDECMWTVLLSDRAGKECVCQTTGCIRHTAYGKTLLLCSSNDTTYGKAAATRASSWLGLQSFTVILQGLFVFCRDQTGESIEDTMETMTFASFRSLLSNMVATSPNPTLHIFVYKVTKICTQASHPQIKTYSQ